MKNIPTWFVIAFSVAVGFMLGVVVTIFTLF
jgi:hypothetical protein